MYLIFEVEAMKHDTSVEVDEQSPPVHVQHDEETSVMGRGQQANLLPALER